MDPFAMRTGQGRSFHDGSLGVFRDGVLGQAFRDGSLGMPPIGASRNQRLQAMRARYLSLRKRGLRGLGDDVSISTSPTVKILGFAALVGLGAYGIYRVTQK